MEAVSGRDLERFFQRWIYGATLPRIAFSHRIEGTDVVLRFEQIGDLFDVPVTVVLNFGDRKTSVLVPVTDKLVEKRVPLEGSLRGVEISKDTGTLAEIVKAS
jgi:aminopeptidase N